MPVDFIEDAPARQPGSGLDFQPLESAPSALDFQPEEAGTLAGIASSFKRGNLAGQRAIEALQFEREGATPRQSRRAFEGAMTDPEYLARLMEAGDDPAQLARVESLFGPRRRVEAITEPKRQQNIATAQNVSDLTRAMGEQPRSAAMKEWEAADNSNWWRVFARNPVEITANIFAESLPQASAAMTAGMAGGAAGGPVGAAAGAGTGSFAVEASNALLEAAAQQGVNLADPDQVRGFFTDESKVKAAREFAMQRGFPIALFDALTAGLAGKFLKPALGRGVGPVARATAAEAGMQMAGGAGGEAIAQASSGQPLSVKDIAAEAIGELATAPGEVTTNLRDALQAKGAGKIDFRPSEPAAVRPEVRPQAERYTAPAADALASLQAAMRGESPESPRLKGPPPAGPERASTVTPSEPTIVEKRVEVPVETEEARAALEMQRRLDEAVAREVANPDKNYAGMSRIELELLESLGDARAIAETRRRRKEEGQKAEREFLDSLKGPEVKPKADYVGMFEEERPDSLGSIVNATERVGAPPLQAAIDAMRDGKTPAQVVSEWGGGGGEHDALIGILEQINEARRNKSLSELGALRKSYGKAFAETSRPNVDTALLGLEQAREQGAAPAGGVPQDTAELYSRLFDEAHGKPRTEPTGQELKVYFLDSVTTNQGRTKKQGGEVGRPLNSLNVGDKFTVRGVELTVDSIDPDTDAVTFSASDNSEFGNRQTLTPEDAPEVFPDFGSYQSGRGQAAMAKPSKPVDFVSSAPKPVASPGNAKNSDPIESALDALKIDTDPSQLHAFGLLPDTWNQLIEIVRAAYRGGKSAAQAIRAGLDWLKEQGASGYDEAAIREHFTEEFKQPTIRQDIRKLEDEMTALEKSGQPIPQEMLDRYKDLADTLGDEIRTGKARSEAGRTRVDENLQQVGRDAPRAPQDGRRGASGPTKIPKFKGSERLPGGKIKDLFQGLTNFRKRAGDWINRWEARNETVIGRDVADNRANQLANQASLRVRLILNRAFGDAPAAIRDKHDTREAALTFVVEANGDRAKLEEFYDAIASSAHADTKAGRQAMHAIEYAEANWEKFEAAAAEYRTLTETERETELNEGVNSHEWRGGYVYHRWQREQEGGADPTSPTPSGTPFRKSRSVASYAEGIAGGRKPQTLNGLELLAERVASGQRRLHELSWLHGLRNMIDPVTNEPVVTDVIREENKIHAMRRGLAARIEDANAAISELEPKIDESIDALVRATHLVGKAKTALAESGQMSQEEIARWLQPTREEATGEIVRIKEAIESRNYELESIREVFSDGEDAVAADLRQQISALESEIESLRSEANYWQEKEQTAPAERAQVEAIGVQREEIAEAARRYNLVKLQKATLTGRRQYLRQSISRYQEAISRSEEAAGRVDKWKVKAPEGYQLFRLGDVEVAVKEGFGKLLTTLTAPSFFKGSKAKKIFGAIKSTLLLFDTFHLGRMAAWRQVMSLGGSTQLGEAAKSLASGHPFRAFAEAFPGYRKGQTLLDYSAEDIREMAARGEIPEAWADGLIENKRKLRLALDTGYNVGNVLDNAWGDALHHLPGIGTFNKWLFGQYQRGAMSEAWLIEFGRQQRARPNEPERVTARRVSKALNERFGNLNRQGLFKSRTAQDLARFVFLAPQWNESLIRSELGAAADLLKAPFDSVKQRRIVVGTLLRATGTMAVGTFLANQILNYAFRGKPTWENEEEGWDKKISAYIPDAVGKGPGFFLNPLALPAEYTHLIEGNLHRAGGDTSEALLRIFNSRLHPASRAASIFVSRRDVLGQKLREGEVLPAMAKAMIPLPIAVPSAVSAGKELVTGEPSESYPGQFQKQLMASFGIKTDQAPNAEQRVRNLAQEFNREKGIVPHAEFFAGDFTDFTKALRIGNQTDARAALEELLQKKTARQVFDHFKRWQAAPFTGQRGREAEFWRTLTEEQRSQYLKSREARRALAQQAAEMLRAAVQ